MAATGASLIFWHLIALQSIRRFVPVMFTVHTRLRARTHMHACTRLHAHTRTRAHTRLRMGARVHLFPSQKNFLPTQHAMLGFYAGADTRNLLK